MLVDVFFKNDKGRIYHENFSCDSALLNNIQTAQMISNFVGICFMKYTGEFLQFIKYEVKK